MLILYTGANTSFNGFPNLASFVAEDAYLPRQLTRRGHRLVFSNGIIILTVVSLALIIVTRANLTALVAMYAIGVFTGFTMAGAGMVKHHLTHREQGWRYKIWINGFAGGLSALVVLIFAVTKFTEGAWVVVVAFPLLVIVLIRLHHQYAAEREELEENAARAADGPRAPPARGPRLRGAARPRDGEGPPVRPHPSSRRAPGGPLRPRHRPSPTSSRSSGSASGSPGFPSTSSSARTGASRGHRCSSSPRRPRTARPRSRCCCRGGCSRAPGGWRCTTGRPTGSRPT